MKYIGYESSLISTENTETKFGLDLEHIDLISWAAFAGCTSLESVRLHNNKCVQFGSFDEYQSLKKISLPSYLHIMTNNDGKILYDFFPSDNIKQFILPSKG